MDITTEDICNEQMNSETTHFGLGWYLHLIFNQLKYQSNDNFYVLYF